MDRTESQRPTHRSFFRFQMRINEILSEYDIAELELFYRTSRIGFPHMAAIVMELIYLAKKGIESGELPDRRQEKLYTTTLLEPPARARSVQVEMSHNERLSEYRSVLESRIAFPKNEDLGLFAMSTLRMKTGWQWDSRENLVRKIWTRILELPPPEKNKMLSRIRAIADNNNILLGPPIEDSFFSSWERIIKDRGRSNDD